VPDESIHTATFIPPPDSAAGRLDLRAGFPCIVPFAKDSDRCTSSELGRPESRSL
jgi:hypothetical protein